MSREGLRIKLVTAWPRQHQAVASQLAHHRCISPPHAYEFYSWFSSLPGSKSELPFLQRSLLISRGSCDDDSEETTTTTTAMATTSAIPTTGLLNLEKELVCFICTEVLYQPLTLIDCLHTFCGSCLKEWFSHQYRKGFSLAYSTLQPLHLPNMQGHRQGRPAQCHDQHPPRNVPRCKSRESTGPQKKRQRWVSSTNLVTTFFPR